MPESKKVVLFIFEGVTEKIALESILKKLFASNHVDVEFIGTDITSNKDVTVGNIDNELRQFIREKLKPLHIDVSDIEKIIHVIDTDGGFVDERYIKYSAQQAHLAYTQNEIHTKDPANTLKRNKEKSEKTNHLKNLSYLHFKSDDLRIPYQLYYFSRNREHALQNEVRELTLMEKKDMALEFASKYFGKENDFVTLLNDSNIKVDGSFGQTWSFIQKANNSLHRHSNFHLVFEDFI